MWWNLNWEQRVRMWYFVWSLFLLVYETGKGNVKKVLNAFLSSDKKAQSEGKHYCIELWK